MHLLYVLGLTTSCVAGLDFPCEGELMALRGTDGYVLWKTRLQSGVTDLNCVDVDVDRDGTPDCIASGKHATFSAVNSKTGQSIVETRFPTSLRCFAPSVCC